MSAYDLIAHPMPVQGAHRQGASTSGSAPAGTTRDAHGKGASTDGGRVLLVAMVDEGATPARLALLNG